ncbi:MAG: hypothetical protein ACRDNM_00120 [Gaiellaceae bacterium]
MFFDLTKAAFSGLVLAWRVFDLAQLTRKRTIGPAELVDELRIASAEAHELAARLEAVAKEAAEDAGVTFYRGATATPRASS